MVEGDKFWYIDRTYERIRSSVVKRVSFDDTYLGPSIWTVGKIAILESNCFSSEKQAVKFFLHEVQGKIRELEARHRAELRKLRRQEANLSRRLK